MFNFFKRKDPDIADALTNQTIGGQSVLYKLFRDGIDCEDATIRRLELTYFAATMTTYVYLRFGKQSNQESILDTFTHSILTQSIPASRENISLGEAVKQYYNRSAEYDMMLPLLFSPDKSSTGKPEVTLLMHAFECITNSSARSHMIQIAAASPLLKDIALDHIDFVKKKL